VIYHTKKFAIFNTDGQLRNITLTFLALAAPLRLAFNNRIEARGFSAVQRKVAMAPKRSAKRKVPGESTTDGTNGAITSELPDRESWPGWVEVENEPVC
jgi:hypothetical protein